MKTNLYFLLVIALIGQACNDDEIETVAEHPLLVSYESVSGNMTLSVNYEYDSEKRVTKISWQRSTPGVTLGSDVFVYDTEGRLKQQTRSITGLTDEVTNYTWDDDLIFASSTYSSDKKIGF